jgi:hypothetical protein
LAEIRFRLTAVLVLRRGGLAPPQAANLLLWGVCATVQALLRAVQAMSEAPETYGEMWGTTEMMELISVLILMKHYSQWMSMAWLNT